MSEFREIDLSKPGDYVIRWIDTGSGRITGMDFVCPCGCGEKDYIPIGRENGHGWDWDGNLDAPTLSPSLLRRSCNWHGFLEQGKWNWCPGTPIAPNCFSPGAQK